MPGENYKILQINALNKLRQRLKQAALEDVEKTHHRIQGRLHPGTVTQKQMQEYFDRKKNPIKVTPINPQSRYQKSQMTKDNFEYFPTPAMIASRLSWLPDVIQKDPFPYATFNVTQSQDRTPTDKDIIWDSYTERGYEPVAGPRGDLTFENLPDNYSRIYQSDDGNYYTVDYRSNNDPLLLKLKQESPSSEKTNIDNTKTNKDSWQTLKNTVKLVMDAAANNTQQNTNKNNWQTLNNVVKLAMDAARKEASKWSKQSKNNTSNNNFQKIFEDTINNLTPDEQSYLDFKGIDFSSAAKLQEGLNQHFNSGLVVDNKFGLKSQAALKNALRLMPLDESFKQRRPDYYGLTTPIVEEQTSVPIEEDSSKKDSPFYGNINPSPVILDRGNIRSILRHYGYNPYDFSGRQRRAFRKYLAGDRTQNIDFLDEEGNLYRDWIAPYTTFKRKQGGRLISKDPIKRFKQTI